MSEDAKLKAELNKAFGDSVHSANKAVGASIAAKEAMEARRRGARDEVVIRSASTRSDRRSTYELIASCIPIGNLCITTSPNSDVGLKLI